MNIALATLALLVLLYPGFLYRRFYYTAEFSREYVKQTITDLVFASILPAFIMHIIGYCLFVKGRYDIDIQVLGTLLSGTTDAARITHAFNSLYESALQIIRYIGVVSALAMIFGILSKKVVRWCKLDRKLPFFRFQNEWHYVFSGEILDFPNIPGKAEDVDFKYVDILVKSDGGMIIYMGILSHYTLNREGGIDRIYLSDVKRRYLRDDAAPVGEDTRYYDLPGEFFIIPYSQIINLHITYYKVELTPELQEEIDQQETED